MGLHDVCRNKYHHFDRDYEVEMIYSADRNDYLMYGVCRECKRMRIVYESELKSYRVILEKLRNASE